ncbi:hypothetical protein [Natrarchaeobius chitinivorans]|uniref:Uncharacterized protein n=1 Tax=Natrarchaeobius chitinivorans TaxID=1679083 RepID=A0A3N6P3D6_NATCH|nr:hypothetical protein [Natrarchaeobius chitinivorans]RQG92209.1 hypothetical protein EA473_16975 [Natrarchaeobius chitinivorans]
MTRDLPESLAETWTPLGTRVGESSVLVVSITAETTLYEPVEPLPLADAVTSDVPLRSLFAVDLSFSPSLSSVGVSPESVHSTAASRAKSQFVDLLEDDGVAVEGVRDDLEFEGPNGSQGTWFVLDVVYPVDPAVTVDGTECIRAEGHVAVWPAETTYGVAGGTLPLETVTLDGDSTEDQRPSTDSAAVDPERDREVVSTLVDGLE